MSRSVVRTLAPAFVRTLVVVFAVVEAELLLRRTDEDVAVDAPGEDGTDLPEGAADADGDEVPDDADADGEDDGDADECDDGGGADGCGDAGAVVLTRGAGGAW